VPESVAKKVSALVEALYDAELGNVRSLTVDLQDSGEHPFRVIITDEDHPLPGVANTKPRS
jgi:hypothetical protein